MRSFADEIEGEEAVYALPSWCDASTKPSDIRAKIVSQRSHNLQNGWECTLRDQKQFAEAEAAADEVEAAAEPEPEPEPVAAPRRSKLAALRAAAAENEAAEPKAADEKPKRQKKKIVIEAVDSDDDNQPSSAEACSALLPPREQLEQLDSALGNTEVNYIELLKGVLQSKEIQQAASELTQSLNNMEGLNKNSHSTPSTSTHEIGTKRPRFVSRKFMSRHGEFPKKEPEPDAAHTLDENLDTLD